jgi:hypothetical protein
MRKNQLRVLSLCSKGLRSLKIRKQSKKVRMKRARGFVLTWIFLKKRRM